MCIKRNDNLIILLYNIIDMNTHMVRDFDHGLFKPGGYFEYLDDERVNSLKPPVLLEDSRTTKLDGTSKYNSEQVLKYIEDAAHRPPYRPSRLQRLTESTNMSRKWAQYTGRFEHQSIMQVGNDMIKTFVDVLNDLTRYTGDESSEDLPTMREIFLKGDRLFYLGLGILVLGVLLKIIS